jgi:hypothetical protein
MRTIHWLSGAVLLAGIALIGCSPTVVQKDSPPDVAVVEPHRGGPPDHAPAHGYRKHADSDVVLVYSSTLEVYVVENHENCYYSAGQYFRTTGKDWQWSVDIAGPWRDVQMDSDLPPGLRKMDVSVHQKKEKKAKKDK